LAQTHFLLILKSSVDYQRQTKVEKVVQPIGHITISLSNSGTYLNIYDDRRK